MLKNVIDIDHSARLLSRTEDDPTLILFDFTTTFPSINRKYTESIGSLRHPDFC